ncbi:type II toxin-antitoxin system Phd/YefM family antitoxin [Planosporangium thailandense]|uniref:Antitoxin n=1 Tax=Planosporangium thailandense TaxID=765197 RepID=A0ABX0XZ85_9ACTN|nr:type II toxin-antitoxin system Phd/YefM family antitoxin [Planosporangium thailandense]NJC70520.1 type II toxin-antitoxin system Phd/YefM family antitoxin [Planosporangium thailandense]
MAYEVPVTQARAEFADLVNRVAYGGERVVVTRHGKPIAALVPPSDLDRLAQGDQPDQQPGTVVRLTADALDRPARPRSTPDRRLDIAARHRPVGGDPGARVD